MLRRAGLAVESRQGTRHLFAVAAVRSYLDDFWPSRLADLKAAVESGAAGAGSGATPGVASEEEAGRD